ILVASRCGEEGAKADRCRLPALPSTPREAERCAARRSRRGRGITAAWNQNRPAALGKTRGLDPEKAPKMRRPSASAPGGLPLAGGLSRLVFGPFRLSRRSPSPREVCMTRNALILIGVVLLVLGIIGFAIPVFTTQQTKDVAKVGDLKLQAKEDTTHSIPPLVSGGVLAAGVILIGAGFLRAR